MEGLSQWTGKKAPHAITKGFLQTVTDNGRVNLMPAILADFAKLISAAKGDTHVMITSAKVIKDFKD